LKKPPKISSLHTSPILKSRQKEIILKIIVYIVLAIIRKVTSSTIEDFEKNFAKRSGLSEIDGKYRHTQCRHGQSYFHAIFNLESAINLACFRLNDLRIATWQEAPRPMTRHQEIYKSSLPRVPLFSPNCNAMQSADCNVQWPHINQLMAM
jgi:hypothetical protein